MPIDTKNPWVPIIAAIIFLFSIGYMTWEYESKRRTKENFVNQLATSTDVTSLTRQRTQLFVQKGLYAFFCSSARSVYANQLVHQIARFVPNHIDYYCRLNDVNKGERCDNMYIDYFSSRDNYVYSLNDEVCNTVNTTIENKDPALSHIRVQNTIYSLQKRCIMFDNLLVSYINGDRKYVVKFTQPFIGDGMRRLSSFVLSRPLFLSINSYGLYQILYDESNASDNASNMFINMSSEDTLSQKSLYLRRVTQLPGDRPRIHHTATIPDSELKDITAFFKESLTTQRQNDNSDVQIVRSARLPMTMYYMNYESTFNSDDKTNVFTFIVDHTLVNRLRSAPNDNLIITGAISGMSDSIATVYHSLKIEYNQQLRIPTIQFNNTSSSGWFQMEMHPTFVSKLPSLTSFHIAVCCAYDTYTICAFAGDHYYMTRRVLQSSMNASGFSFSRSSIETVLKRFKELQLNSAPGMIDTFKYDSIPNYALLARYLGYNV